MTGLSRSDLEFKDKIMELSPIGICVLGPDGRLAYVNTRGREILGLGLGEGETGHRLQLSAAWNDPEQHGRPPQEENFVFERIQETGKPLKGVRLAVQRSDGTRAVLAVNASPLLDGSGQFNGVIAAYEDITERIGQEALADQAARLEEILWLVPIGIQIVDSEGRNVYANRRAQEILGLSFDEITRRYSHSSAWQITNMEGNPIGPRERIFWRVKESLQPLYDQKLMVRRPDEHWIAISVNAQPLFDDAGRFSGLASAIKDITDIVLMERELLHRQEQLEETVMQRTQTLEQLNLQLQREMKVGEDREVELESTNRRLQALSLFLQSSREEERSRSAYRVHDEIGQNLTVLQMALKNLEKDHLQGENAAETMQRVYEIMDQLAELVKTISEELRPPILDDAGLVAALEWQCSDFQEKTGIDCAVEQGVGEATLDFEKSTAVFRVFQEIMSNLALQPGIDSVKVETKLEEEHMVMAIEVGGDGIDEEDLQRADPLSLVFMREYLGRFGGEVGIIALGGKGKMVVVRVPV